jgi:hypothetical protein
MPIENENIVRGNGLQRSGYENAVRAAPLTRLRPTRFRFESSINCTPELCAPGVNPRGGVIWILLSSTIAPAAACSRTPDEFGWWLSIRLPTMLQAPAPPHRIPSTNRNGASPVRSELSIVIRLWLI